MSRPGVGMSMLEMERARAGQHGGRDNDDQRLCGSACAHVPHYPITSGNRLKKKIVSTINTLRNL